MNFSQAEKSECPLHLRGAIGLDEAGRGCLAGPVVAACVLLPDSLPRIDGLEKLTDSKLLSEVQRQRLEPKIKEVALGWSLGFVWPAEIDALNILQASLRAMCLACASMLHKLPFSQRNDLYILIDGNQKLPGGLMLHALKQWGLDNAWMLPQEAVVGGDSKILSIAAASVLAKVARDRFMLAAHRKYPQYAFNRHKGYATGEHLEMLKRHGLCPLHRRSFKGCREETLPLPLKSDLLTGLHPSRPDKTQKEQTEIKLPLLK
ncbi:MAG: ribonuclease HII [Desulfovibrionaceae bacterium]|nr:ribonuclease HII [Desulfovibrionaceae bacterium]